MDERQSGLHVSEDKKERPRKGNTERIHTIKQYRNVRMMQRAWYTDGVIAG